jgi:DNA-binding NtrC family response regulator
VIEIPPLVDRPEDIPAIVTTVIERSEKRQVKVGRECLAFLQAYDWPQNVRQLIQVVESMLAFSTGRSLSIGDIPNEILQGPKGNDGIDNVVSFPSNRAGGTNGGIQSQIDNLNLNIPLDADWEKAMRLFQTKFLIGKIQSHDGPKDQRTLATHLGISKGSLGRRLKELNIDIQEVVSNRCDRGNGGSHARN